MDTKTSTPFTIAAKDQPATCSLIIGSPTKWRSQQILLLDNNLDQRILKRLRRSSEEELFTVS